MVWATLHEAKTKTKIYCVMKYVFSNDTSLQSKYYGTVGINYNLTELQP